MSKYPWELPPANDPDEEPTKSDEQPKKSEKPVNPKPVTSDQDETILPPNWADLNRETDPFAETILPPTRPSNETLRLDPKQLPDATDDVPPEPEKAEESADLSTVALPSVPPAASPPAKSIPQEKIPPADQTVYRPRPQPQYRQPHPARQQKPSPKAPVTPTISPYTIWLRRLIRVSLILTVILLLGALLVVVSGVTSYAYIASQLPDAETLRNQQFKFRTSTIYDRNGRVLWEINDPQYGRRTDVGLVDIAPDLRNATIATEDRNFYLNVGVDPIAIARAVYYNVTEGSIVSGGSTITQQLVKNVLLSEAERTERSLVRKVKEAVLAMEVNRAYDKNVVLEIYLNQIYYGNLAYGIEAASNTYFGKRASQLSLGEAALLAGLPQSPAVHDPHTNPEGAKRRQEIVLGLMVEDGYITLEQAKTAAAEPVIENLRPLGVQLEAPHFVNLVRAELEAILPSEWVYQAGWRIETTLDKRLQDLAEETVTRHVDALAGRNVTNGALVAIDPTTGELLAMVGSKDFRDEAIAGQINMAVVPRQPGSSIKPLVFLAAMERSWTPSTLIMDVPVEYPDWSGNVYAPVNYDEKFHGAASMRIALANSYNIPAVKGLEFVGVDALKDMAARLGITTLTRDDYGLALSLGAGEVPLIEMTGAYQALANRGLRIRPHTIRRVQDHSGNEIPLVQNSSQRVISEQHAYLMTHILADNEARSRSFGQNSALKLSRPAAAKTGTTNDFRDNLVLGYTPDMVVGVWVGNADYTPMEGTTGLSGAGPIWHDFMEDAHEGLPVRDFIRPDGIVEHEVCADSGTFPSEVCPKRRTEIFAEDQPPLDAEFDIHQLIEIDLNTGKRANEFCRTRIETRKYEVYPPDGREWAIEQGIEQPPEEYCPSSAITAQITAPTNDAIIRGTVQIFGRALAADFSYYELEYGVGTGPQAFGKIGGPQSQLVEGGLLGVIDTTQLPNGPYTIRLLVFDRSGGGLESRIHVLIDNVATPAPPPTSTALPTATFTAAPNQPPPTPTPTTEPTPAPL
ncbi:MAG: PBP1A family penicillin-binding protein, partial [Chloroflexota bacterium]